MAVKTQRTSMKRDVRIASYDAVLPRVMVGTGREVSAALSQSPARRTLAVTFDSEQEQEAAEEVYRRIGEFLPQLIRSRRQDKLSKVVEGLLPEMAPSRSALVQVRMQAEARSQILTSGDYVRAADVAKLAGYSDNNPSAQPSKWKRDGAIFVVEHNGADYFPLFGLNPEKSYKPYAAVAEVLKVFGAKRSGWSIAFWFAALNSFLDDRRPQDLLAAEPDLIVAAAKDEVEGQQHG
ncbi:hypothetical protein [Acidicapsa ligni]|uniref:hypothetical protein n=1 Tax=Acidicapsa ligni TaxID=542300 RepID=UPI0021DFDE8C|nr:hypothetical protein [Acidicapsa ligni]